MLLSLNWLKDYVNIPKSITPEELGLRLTMHTVEIDEVVKQADKYKQVVVGKIIAISKHPQADKLQLARVDVKEEELEIICGAANIKVGQLVPVALIGAVLPGGMEIKEAKIRGVKSSGMLCAEDELGLGDDHSGILILDKKALPGQKLADYLKLKDVIFTVDNKSITNRPDLWSHYGVAREVAAFLNTRMKKYDANLQINANPRIANDTNVDLNVKVEDFKLCSRYMAVAIGGIVIEPSPEWLQERLVAAGVRPINNIVDITNYIMMDLGQPLHAFDMARIAAGKNSEKCNIVVRKAKKAEMIKTLDGEKRELDQNMLVIADSQEPVAIAGIMGGVGSEISDNTETIVIESANFDFISIRKTASRLGLRTEASMRFEKALDPNLCELALARAVQLIIKICPRARVVSDVKDEKKFSLNQGPLTVSTAWLRQRVGKDIKIEKIIDILTRLGFIVLADKKPAAGDDDYHIKIKVPTWRATRDVSINEDIVEEVARIYGYGAITPIMPKVAMRAPKMDAAGQYARQLKNILSGGAGMTEVYNYSFVGEEQLTKLGLDHTKHIRIANPIAAHHTLLRQNLAPNLINAVKANQAKHEDIRLFEIGRVFLADMNGEEDRGGDTDGKLPYQEKRLGLAAANNEAAGLSEIKGIVEYALAGFGLSLIWQEIEAVPAWADPAKSAKIIVNQVMIGLVGVLAKKAQKQSGLKKEIALAEISLPELFKVIKAHSVRKYQAYAKYPPVTRDLAFVVDEKILYNDIRKEIINFHDYIQAVELFDVYQGSKLGPGKKNLAFHIIYQADRTLSAKEVDEMQEQLIQKLAEKFESKIRDF